VVGCQEKVGMPSSYMLVSRYCGSIQEILNLLCFVCLPGCLCNNDNEVSSFDFRGSAG
jgi:hypothetical protein